jgi:hypothetical protein
MTGSVTREQMCQVLVHIAEHSRHGLHIVEVPEICGSHACAHVPRQLSRMRIVSANTSSYQGNEVNYESACTWDICSLQVADEMVGTQRAAVRMQSDEILDDLHIRILRVTEDLRAIQQQLNCAAMQAPGDPELMEALCQLPEMESLQFLKAALDQMRHFLWFYTQVITNESADAEQLRESIRQKPSPDAVVSPRVAAAEKFRHAADAALLQLLADGKIRKPN